MDEVLTCPKCSETGFKDAKHRGRHLWFKHGISGAKHREQRKKANSLVCTECQLPCKSISGLALHRSKKHGVPGKTARYKKRKRTELAITEPRTPRAASVLRSTGGFPLTYIGHVVGYLEAKCHAEAYENGLPAKSFTRDVAEYFFAKTRMGDQPTTIQ